MFNVEFFNGLQRLGALILICLIFLLILIRFFKSSDMQFEVREVENLGDTFNENKNVLNSNKIKGYTKVGVNGLKGKSIKSYYVVNPNLLDQKG